MKFAVGDKFVCHSGEIVKEMFRGQHGTITGVPLAREGLYNIQFDNPILGQQIAGEQYLLHPGEEDGGAVWLEAQLTRILTGLLERKP